MSHLIVVGFQGIHRAAEVLDELKHFQSPGTFELDDALAVYRTERGRLRTERSMNPSKAMGASFGGVIGALVGAIVALPFTAGGSVVAASAIAANAVMVGTFGAGVGAEDAKTFENQHGFREEFVREVSAMIQPGSSALFTLGDANDPLEVARHFRGYGGTVLSTTLSTEKAASLQRILRA